MQYKDFKVGMVVSNHYYGTGKVVSLNDSTKMITVQFLSVGDKAGLWHADGFANSRRFWSSDNVNSTRIQGHSCSSNHIYGCDDLDTVILFQASQQLAFYGSLISLINENKEQKY